MTDPEATTEEQDGLVRTSSAEIRARQAAAVVDDEEEPPATPRTASREVEGEPAVQASEGPDDPDDGQPETTEEAEPAAETASDSEPDAEPDPDGEPAQQSLSSLDDVAKKHAGGKKVRSKKKRTRRKPRREEREDPPATPIEQTGMLEPTSVRVRTTEDAVPNEETPTSDPSMVAVGPIEPEEGEQFPDLSGSAMRQPANLSDICRLYRIGQDDAACYLEVQRKEPKSIHGQPSRGYIGKIRRPMSEAEFKDMAGGGAFELTVYGPDPRGTRNPWTGAPEKKRLTKPIRLEIAGTPQIVDFDEDDILAPGRKADDMHSGWSPMERRRPGPVTSAEASVASSNANLISDLVKASMKNEAELRKEVKEASGRPGTDPAIIDAFKESSKDSIEAVRQTAHATQRLYEQRLNERDREIEEMRQELKAMRDRPAESGLDGVAKVLAAIKPPENASSDINRVYEQHRDEVRRIIEGHREEVRNLRASYDDKLKSKDEELRRLEEHQRARESDLRESADRRERDLKEEFERRERALKESHSAEIERLRADHTRELENVRRQEELMRQTTQTSWENKVAMAEERARLAEQRAEEERNRAEEKADFATQLSELQQNAELLGLRKGGDDNPPQDWKERLSQAVGNAFENLPDLVQQIGSTIDKRRQMVATEAEAMRTAAAARALPQQRPQQRPGARNIRGAGGQRVAVQRPARPTGWTTEEAVPGRQAAPTEPELRPEQRPPPTEEDRLRQEAERAHHEQQQRLATEGAAPRAEQAVQPSGPPPQQSPPLPSNGGARHTAIPPGMVQSFRVPLEQAFTQGASPEEVADGLRQTFGPEQLQTVLRTVSVEDLITALSEDPSGASSPLLSRDGTTWFRQVWDAGARMVTPAN